jgi:hypothetical protein
MIYIVLSIFFSFFQPIIAQQTQGQYAEQVLNLVEYQLPAPSIIGEREWKELQLDRLVTTLDRTKTSFGRWGLVQLLHPIADEKELEKRKQIITYLIEHENDMRMFQKQLERVHAVETSLLAYWDKHDELNKSSRRFYFSTIGGLNELNKSSIALNASTIFEGFNSVKDFLQSFALAGVAEEFARWSFGVQDDFSVTRGIQAGFAEPIMRHSPWLYKLTDGPYTARDAALALSWGDVYNVYKKGFFYKKTDNSMQEVPGLGKLGAFLVATVGTLMSDYQTLNRADSSIKRVVSIFKDLNDLHVRVCDVAQCVDAIKKLNLIVSKQSPILRAYLRNDNDDERKDFIKKLLAPRFLKKSDYLYSRGHVLTMHLEITQQKKTFIPLLHSVALLDAYCSIAQLYKEGGFCFPEFLDSATPVLDYQDVWLPLLPRNQAIPNDLMLGGSKPSKMVITGPNGGGKSTILEALGIAAVLPQSWCIAPCKEGKQSIFTSIKVSFDPNKNKRKGESTGVASIRVMNELREDIRRSPAQERMLVLIDEPYRGLVDVVAEERIYEFGIDVAEYNQAAVVIATHLRAPMMLPQATRGVFDNYQVKIREVSRGIFERLFKLEHGAATWWFEDSAKRNRFVDWISAKSNVSE